MELEFKHLFHKGDYILWEWKGVQRAALVIESPVGRSMPLAVSWIVPEKNEIHVTVLPEHCHEISAEEAILWRLNGGDKE